MNHIKKFKTLAEYTEYINDVKSGNVYFENVSYVEENGRVYFKSHPDDFISIGNGGKIVYINNRTDASVNITEEDGLKFNIGEDGLVDCYIDDTSTLVINDLLIHPELQR